MQKAYLMALYELAEKDPNVVLLLADSGTSYDELFKRYLPNQILDFGIAEENMVASAAGMASCGKVPYVFTASAFLAYRSFEFIRDDVCMQNHNVKFVGMGAGLGWSTLGPTHHTTEEIGLLRAIPNLLVLSPSCPSMTSKCIKYAYKHNGPVYVRIGMGGEEELYNNDLSEDVLKNRILCEGDDVIIFATGTIVAEAVKVNKILSEMGVKARIIDVCALSPFDKESVLEQAKTPIVTFEEHSIIGGLGSIVSEILADNGISAKFLRLGLNHEFAKGYGTVDEVRKQNGLDAETVAEKIYNWLKGNKYGK